MSSRSSIPVGSGSLAGPAEPGGVWDPITAGPGRSPRAPYSTSGWTAGKAPAFTADARSRPTAAWARGGTGQERVDPEQVAGRAEAGDLADRGGRDHRVVPERLSSVDVRQM